MGLSGPSQPNPVTLTPVPPLVSNLPSHPMWPPFPPLQCPVEAPSLSPLASRAHALCLSPFPCFIDLKINPHKKWSLGHTCPTSGFTFQPRTRTKCGNPAWHPQVWILGIHSGPPGLAITGCLAPAVSSAVLRWCPVTLVAT